MKYTLISFLFFAFQLITHISSGTPLLLPDSWTGPSSSSVGSTTNYTFDNGTLYFGVTWYVAKGSVVSSSQSGTTYSVSIQWTESGTGTIQIAYDVDILISNGSKNVTISGGTPPPSPPNTTFTTVYNCGSTVVTRNTNPSASYDWYWQTTPTGATTVLGKAASITLTTPINLYLRSTLKVSPYTWSTTAQSVGTITVYATAPEVPTISTDGSCFQNGSVSLSVETVSGATSYKWYTSAGTLIDGVTTNTYTVPSLSATTTYYVSSFAGVCESTERKAVTATLEPLPQIQTIGSQRITMGSPVTLGVTETYTSYSWRNSSNTEVGTGSTYQTSVAGQYSVVVTKAGVNGSGLSPVFTLSGGLTGQNLNYIVSNTIQTGGVTDVNTIGALTVLQNSQTTQYFDGLGRPIQSVVTQGSPGKKDIVQPIAYDQFGRQGVSYLPYTSGNDGWYKTDFIPKDKTEYATSSNPQFQFYQQTLKVAEDRQPFAETIFEASPLNRVVKQGSPGEAWQPNDDPNIDRSIKMSYGFNQLNEVLHFEYDEETEEIAMESLSHYGPKQLYKNKVIDEHNNEVIEFKDKEGKTILKKVQYKEENGVKLYAETYYIYDDFGNLITVLPPEATKTIKAQSGL